MRALLVALIALIVVVSGGTAVLLMTKPRTAVEPPAGESAKPAKPPKPERPKLGPDGQPDPFADAEPRPDPPKASDRSELKPLNEAKTLYLETTDTGARRVLFAADVCLQQTVLEVLVCKKRTKEHEAILHTDLDARFLHAALLAAGATSGKPVQFVNPKTDEPEYTPASGTPITVLVHYTKGGREFTHPAQEWIQDKNTGKPMAHRWVFAGSRFVKNPDRPQDPEYYCANNGEVIAISNFPDSMLDLPVQVSDAADQLHFEAIPKKIPPLGSGVWVILEPVPGKK